MPQELLRSVSEHAGHCGVHGFDDASIIDHDDTVHGCVDDRAQPRLAAVHGGFGLLQVRHVDVHDDGPIALVPLHGRDDDAEPAAEEGARAFVFVREGANGAVEDVTNALRDVNGVGVGGSCITDL